MTMNSTDLGHVRVLDAQQDERIRLECSVTSKFDAEEVDVESDFIRLNAFTSLPEMNQPSRHLLILINHA